MLVHRLSLTIDCHASERLFPTEFLVRIPVSKVRHVLATRRSATEPLLIASQYLPPVSAHGGMSILIETGDSRVESFQWIDGLYGKIGTQCDSASRSITVVEQCRHMAILSRVTYCKYRLQAYAPLIRSGPWIDALSANKASGIDANIPVCPPHTTSDQKRYIRVGVRFYNRFAHIRCRMSRLVASDDYAQQGQVRVLRARGRYPNSNDSLPSLAARSRSSSFIIWACSIRNRRSLRSWPGSSINAFSMALRTM